MSLTVMFDAILIIGASSSITDDLGWNSTLGFWTISFFGFVSSFFAIEIDPSFTNFEYNFSSIANNSFFVLLANNSFDSASCNCFSLLLFDNFVCVDNFFLSSVKNSQEPFSSKDLSFAL